MPINVPFDERAVLDDAGGPGFVAGLLFHVYKSSSLCRRSWLPFRLVHEHRELKSCNKHCVRRCCTSFVISDARPPPCVFSDFVGSRDAAFPCNALDCSMLEQGPGARFLLVWEGDVAPMGS